MIKELKKLSSILLILILLFCFTACDNQNSQENSIQFFVDNELYSTSTDDSNIPYAPQKDGYEFAGWYRDINNLKSEFEISSYKWDKSLQVYAVWRLHTPIITNDNGVLNWDDVLLAEDYLLKINGAEYSTSDTTFVMPEWEYGVTYNIQIVARTQERGYMNSNVSNNFSFIREAMPLDIPSNIHCDGCVLMWDTVPNAAGYICRINGRQYYVDNLPQIDLSDKIEFYGEYGFEVIALGDGLRYSNSNGGTGTFILSSPKGSGTESDPYVFTNAKHMINFLEDYSSTLNKYYELGSDINLGGENFVYGFPDYKFLRHEFEGIFNGNGHTISNFNLGNIINRNHYGLFGEKNKGIIKNLNIKDFTIDIRCNETYMRIGGLVGQNSGHIINCSASGNINVSTSIRSEDSTLYIGGIVGENYYYDSVGADPKNEKLKFAGNINVDSTSKHAEIKIGGIIGSGSIKECSATGNISLQCEVKQSKCNDHMCVGKPCSVGGLVGRGSATQSWSTNSVKCEYNVDYEYIQSGVYVGGLIGNGSATNCYSTGDVSLGAKLYSVFSKRWMGHGYVGGLIGSASNIRNCYTASNVFVIESEDDYDKDVDDSYATVGGKGYKIAGGLCGSYSSDGEFINSLVLGNVSSTLNICRLRFNRVCKKTSNCYFYENQLLCGHLFTENQDVSTTNAKTCSKNNLNSASFYTDKLQWDSSIWDFANLDIDKDKLPTLKVAQENRFI